MAFKIILLKFKIKYLNNKLLNATEREIDFTFALPIHHLTFVHESNKNIFQSSKKILA